MFSPKSWTVFRPRGNWSAHLLVPFKHGSRVNFPWVMLGFNSQATEYLLSHIWDSHQTECLEEGDGKGNGKGMWLSGEKGTQGSRAAGRKDDFFFAGTPASVEARMALNGFLSPAFFISRLRFLCHIGPQSQGGFSCGMITQQRHFTWDIRGQQFPYRRQQVGLFTREHCSCCGGQIQATDLSLCAICAYGCSVRRCCCLEPHESWTQRGLSLLCWMRPTEHMKVSEAEKSRSKPQKLKHIHPSWKPRVASCENVSNEEAVKGSHCQ